ncbi:MAG: PSP1 domain-containing protein [Bacteroidales bacterium]
MIYRGCHALETDNSDCYRCNTQICAKLSTYNWTEDIATELQSNIVEVRFKNTRKGFYVNVNELDLRSGDIVAVEASPGHDIGIVSLTGMLAVRQYAHSKAKATNEELKKIYRKARSVDIEKWQAAIAREHETMLRARKISEQLRLEMKIGDVEYQGDGTKAIFYYIADERVDFRELIKVLAEEFRVRIEMRQIGARQEAGRIGGIGTCGRELCCSTWISQFVSVSTAAARYQEIALNPQKLAGQCGKLKCCLNFELDVYLDAQKDFPDTTVALETDKGTLRYQKSDFFRYIMWYALPTENGTMQFIPLSVEKVNHIIELNKQGQIAKIEQEPITYITGVPQELDYHDVIGDDSLTRFDHKKPQEQQHSRSPHAANHNHNRNRHHTK